MARLPRSAVPSARFVSIRVSDTERDLFLTAARVNRQQLSAFIREAALSAAGDCLESVPSREPGRSPVDITPRRIT